jgi:LysR family malonate utilization transcriptional regulator
MKMPWNEINFKKLSIFIAFMQERNIGRTAARLRMSPVSVHRALHSLEDSLDFPLFANRGRDLVPGKSAETLLPVVRQTMNQFQAGLAMSMDSAGVERGVLRLGVLCSLIPEVLPNLLSRMAKRKPQLKMEVVSGSNSQLFAFLNAGDIDAALAGSPYINAGKLNAIPLFQDVLCLGCPASSPLSGRKSIDVPDLEEKNFIALSDGFSTTMMQEEAFRIANITPCIVARVNDIFSMVHLVALGVGFTLLPGRMRGLCRNHQVAMVPLSDKYRLEQDIALVYKPGSEKNRNLLALAAECRTYRRNFLS